MKLTETHLLKDDPADEDELGTHSKLVTLLAEEIQNSLEGRSIALVGEWGSGKSTVIRLLEKKLLNSEKIEPLIFTYDAWSHQGDSLRRSFLDDLITEFRSRTSSTTGQPYLTPKQKDGFSERIWNRQEITETTTDPVIRRHSLLLLLSLALIPLGARLLEIPSTSSKESVWPSLQTCRNATALFLMAAPIPLIAVFGLINIFGPNWLRRWLFGVKDDNLHFSVLSFFFERVQGKRERKLVKTPVDSIIEFKRIFLDVLTALLAGEQARRLVIIIDNIDRIPAEQAKDFWSTMQTFFGDGGGLERSRSSKYWLVAPFSVNALSFIFQKETAIDVGPEAADATWKARAYIDKSFGMAVHVPPPILANWRDYLLGLLQKAFPKLETEELVEIRELYGITKPEWQVVTPRALKLFVNSLVILYRQRGSEISLPVIATFLNHRDEIAKGGITPTLLSDYERTIVDRPNLLSMIAALHYGVSPEDGNQILFRERIENALRHAQASRLTEIESNEGFTHVLVPVAREIIASTSGGIALARIAATIDQCKAAGSYSLSGVWRQIRQRIATASDWDAFKESPIEGLIAVIRHSPKADLQPTLSALAKSISSSSVDDPPEDTSRPTGAATIWIQTAICIIEAGGADAQPIAIPGSARFKLEILQQLGEWTGDDAAKASITVSNAEEIDNIVAAEIAAKRPLRNPAQFVALVSDVTRLGLTWTATTKAVAARLRDTAIPPAELLPNLTLLVSIASIARHAGALQLIGQLSKQGALTNFLHHNRKALPVRTAIVVATILGNPAFERPEQANQSSEGDKYFNELVGAATLDEKTIQAVAKMFVEQKATSSVYRAGAESTKVGKFCAAVIGAIVKMNVQFDIDPRYIVENGEFLQRHSQLVDAKDFFAKVIRPERLIEVISGDPFEVSRIDLYLATMELAAKLVDGSYFLYLENGIQQLSQSHWKDVLDCKDDFKSDALQLCEALSRQGHRFELSANTNARSAILEKVREVAGGQGDPIEGRETAASVMKLLPAAQQRSLVRDVVDDMAAKGEAAAIQRTLKLFGSQISAEALSDADRVIRRIFNPALRQPDDVSVDWVTRMIESKPNILRDAERDAVDEFELCLRTALADSSLAPTMREGIGRIATVAGIDVSTAESQPEDKDSPEAT
jgi:hypothetical protein